MGSYLQHTPAKNPSCEFTDVSERSTHIGSIMRESFFPIDFLAPGT